jgi:hypothetical protein
MIEAAAMRKGGRVFTLPRPARHCHFLAAYNAAAREQGWDFKWIGWNEHEISGAEQGFLTDDGDFLGRLEAAQHAIASGQISPKASASGRERGHLNHPPNLYTEDLW